MITDREITQATSMIEPPATHREGQLRVIDHRKSEISYQPDDVGSGLGEVSGSTEPILVTAEDVSFDLERVLDRFRDIIRPKSMESAAYLSPDPTYLPSTIVSEGGFTLVFGYGRSLRVYALRTRDVRPADRVYVYEYGKVHGSIRDRDQAAIRILVADMQAVASALTSLGT